MPTTCSSRSIASIRRGTAGADWPSATSFWTLPAYRTESRLQRAQFETCLAILHWGAYPRNSPSQQHRSTNHPTSLRFALPLLNRCATPGLAAAGASAERTQIWHRPAAIFSHCALRLNRQDSPLAGFHWFAGPNGFWRSAQPSPRPCSTRGWRRANTSESARPRTTMPRSQLIVRLHCCVP